MKSFAVIAGVVAGVLVLWLIFAQSPQSTPTPQAAPAASKPSARVIAPLVTAPDGSNAMTQSVTIPASTSAVTQTVRIAP